MENSIHLSMTLHCPTHVAFRHFVEPALLESWLTEKAQVEPRQGGRYELFWDLDDPERDSTLGCTITAYQENELLAFNWKGPTQFKGFMNDAAPPTHVTVALVPRDGDTVVHLVHSGWGSSQHWQEARAYFERAWGTALSKLTERVVEKQA